MTEFNTKFTLTYKTKVATEPGSQGKVREKNLVRDVREKSGILK
jgi:hypothetical protein